MHILVGRSGLEPEMWHRRLQLRSTLAASNQFRHLPNSRADVFDCDRATLKCRTTADFGHGFMAYDLGYSPHPLSHTTALLLVLAFFDASAVYAGESSKTNSPEREGSITHTEADGALSPPI